MKVVNFASCLAAELRGVEPSNTANAAFAGHERPPEVVLPDAIRGYHTDPRDDDTPG
jgi:hypothetical protein